MSSFANSKNMISVSNASSLIFNKFQSDNFFVRCMLYNLSSTVAHLSGILFHESGHRGAIRELDGKVKYFGLVKPKSYLIGDFNFDGLLDSTHHSLDYLKLF